jgi:hypothetical protein
MNPIQKQFLTYYSILSGKKTTSIPSILKTCKKKDLLLNTIDLLMVKYAVNNRCLSFSDLLYETIKDKIDLGHFYYNFINIKDPFIKEHKQDYKNPFTAIIYNPSYISEITAKK